MPMPASQLVYDTGTPPVVAQGLSYDEGQVDEMLLGPVKEILQDTTGNAEIQQLLASVVNTDFEQQGLQQLLADNTVPDNWRVGEAIAEAFVANSGVCHFPWPTSRDLKNPNASPAGCDLTGFQTVEDNDNDYPYRFAFGEVKTSEQNVSPPSVMTSLGKQLTRLRNNRKTKDALCRYLGHHAARSNWEAMYKSAAKRYLQSNRQDIAVYGVLVRDITPQETDIAACAAALADDCPAQTNIEIVALYLPKNGISTLSDRAQAAMAAEEGL